MIDRRIALLFATLLYTASLLSSPSRLAAQPSPPNLLEALAGEYTNPADPVGGYSFYVQSGRLIIESSRLVPSELAEISPTVYNITAFSTSATFSLDASGQGTGVSFSNDPSTFYVRTGPPLHHVFHDYVRTEAMIPMRDGIKLHAVVLTPSDISYPLPILIQRTPYGVDDTSRSWFFANRPELARAGYIYVGEDIRGRFGSEGKFVMMRPLADHSDPKNTDESTDAYDTVAWLVDNVPHNNGRVGVLGTSYPGFLATMAGIDPHPAVKAVSPQAPMIDVWLGDDFFHNGAFRQTYGYDYVLSMESSKIVTKVNYGTADGQPVDGYDFFLSRGSFLAEVKQSGSKMLPTWKLFLDHPTYDSYWRARGVEYSLNSVAVPTLTVGGYYDQEDMWGPQAEYAKLQQHDNRGDNFLVLGPWRHGSWSSSSFHLGNLNYGEPIGKEFREQIEEKFFARYLKDESGFTLNNTASFQTGSNTWKYYAEFPPHEAHTARLHLAGKGALTWADSTGDAATSYVSDPANPVPYRHRPIQPTYADDSQWYTWLTEDQRFVADRKDIAVWKLPVLDHNLTLTGEVLADIFASTTGSDADLVVKLIDQYPADDPDAKMRGYQLLTNAEIFRGRYLTGFDHPAALPPNTIDEFKFSLHDVDHVFKAGHTVVVEIQSTWFPLYDRNPQTFVSNIMKAKPRDFQPATITIHSGPVQDSALELPVIGTP